jgi:uncharacterized RDD family membrane protein YckC
MRCRRCGRKDDDRLTGGLSLVTNGRAGLCRAPVLAAGNSRRSKSVVRPPRDMGRAVQRFAVSGSPRFERRHDGVPAHQGRGTAQAPRQNAQARAGRQEKLELLEAAPAKPRTLSTTVEARIYCEALVAAPLHRAVAAAMDWAMVLIAYGFFLLAFRLLGGRVFLTQANLVVFGIALLLIGFTYSLLPAIACTETLGMRWARLRLTTFDGFPLEPRQRILRMLGSCLSVCSAVGLLWSLVDEESLAWQDHISGTFPTLAVDR